MSSEISIKVENLSKCYQIYDQPRDRLKQFIVPRLQRAIGQASRHYFREFWALKDVSFEVRRGETVGIIGRNGSGKSTLLQMICGTLNPTSGNIQTHGRIAALLELGSGFNPEFSGRENVYMNGAVLGLSREEIDQRFDAIAAFADIGDFLEQPVKTYSSGMMVRLAFAVIAHVDADILVVDEALAVGDAFFTQKCMRYLRSFMKTGTILFVSHDTASVRSMCNKAIWLEKGNILQRGSPKEVCETYLEAFFEAQQGKSTTTRLRVIENDQLQEALKDQRHEIINASNLRNDIQLFQFNPDAPSFGKGEAQITSVQFLDVHKNSLAWIVGGEDVVLMVEAVAHSHLESPIIGFYVKDKLGQVLFGDNTYLSYMEEPVICETGEYFICGIFFPENNRQLESLLVTAEKFSAIATASGYRDYYPERDLDEAWKIVLRNQFHDILDGSSIGPVYDEVAGFYRQARMRGERALDFSLETISNAIDTRGEGFPVVVYNPLLWERTEPAIADVIVPPDAKTAKPWAGTLRMTDGNGRNVPVQALEKRVQGDSTVFRIVFIAEGVPSLGYKLYRVIPAETEGAGPKGVRGGANELENDFLRVRLDPKTGWIESLYDKAAKREVLAGPGNVLEAITDEPKEMSAWELGLKGPAGRAGEAGATIELVEKGPVRAVIRVRSRFRDSIFEQDLTLYAGLPRLDCRMRLDWRERNIMIKAAFPLDVKTPAARFEIPYGSIARPADGTEVPALRWIDVSEGSGAYGVALLNDSKYGFDVKGGVMRMSVVHGATYPDPEADRGRQELLYSVLPHSGDWMSAAVTRKGLELGNPLIARTPLVHAGALPEVYSFIKAGPANVILSAVKKEMGYAEPGLILRLYEIHGEKAAAKIEFPWPVEAAEADLIERPTGKPLGSGQVITVPLAPYEIKTIRVVRK